MRFFLLIIVIFSVLTSGSNAESKMDNRLGDSFKIGVGVGINFDKPVVSIGFEGVNSKENGTIFTVPIHINKNFRIEPELGFLSTTVKKERNKKYTTNVINYGIGLAYKLNYLDNTSIFVGPKIGFIRNSVERADYRNMNNIIDETRTDFYLGAAVAGEYMLSKLFSIGAELQIIGISMGEDESKKTSFTRTPTATKYYTNGSIFVRFYFN